MIGKTIIGKNFRGCINYCLDKKQAEVLDYNLCYGNKKELIEQCNDVRNLNQKLAKPVQHMTISLAPGEKLSKEQLISLAAGFATEMGFDKNQYIVVQHHDTDHQHIHIIVNRVGLDGKTLSDSNNYKKMAECCRKMEQKFKLKQILSPRRFQNKAQRQLPRMDSRKEKLKQDIQQSLSKAKNYREFEQSMNRRGYKLEKGRGVAFTDDKNVRIKGSEVGYSLSTIEKILTQPIGQRNTLQLKNSLNKGLPKKLMGKRPKKQSAILLPTKSPMQENIADILTDKPAYEENINQRFKKKRGQRL